MAALLLPVVDNQVLVAPVIKARCMVAAAILPPVVDNQVMPPHDVAALHQGVNNQALALKGIIYNPLLLLLLLRSAMQMSFQETTAGALQ